MQTLSLNFPTLGYRQVKTYALAALFVLGNILLPQLCHLLPLGGIRWLPIYFFTLVGAYRYGWKVGLLVAVASPALNSALFGMPAACALPVIVCKSLLLAIAAGLTAKHLQRVSVLWLAAVVLFYQVFGGLAEWVLTSDFQRALQDFRIGVPGMLLQVFGGWVVIRLMRK